MLQVWKMQNIYMSYNRKRIIKEVKFHLQIFEELARNLLKRCYLTTIICYAKLAPTRGKCFIVCKCVSSHPANLQLTNESRHMNRNLIRKWASNMMICMPERGSVTKNSRFPTPRIIMLRHSLQPKVQYSLMYQLRKWETPRTARDCCPEVFPQTEELCDVTYAYPDMEPNVEMSSKQPDSSPTNPPQFQTQCTS